MAEHHLPRQEIAGLQVLRALASLAVVVHHTMEESGAAGRFFPDWLTTSGAAGVDVFFVISGFIMLVTTFDFPHNRVTPSSFLRKRFTRIYPFYWVCCGVMTLVLAAGLLKSMPRDPWFLLRSFLLLPSPRYLVGVAWTLAYEVLFYLIFAATLLARSRDRAVLMTIAAISALVLGTQFGMKPGVWREFLKNSIMFEFCFGLGLAWMLKGRLSGPPVWLGIAAGLVTCLASALIHHDSTNGLTGAARVIGWGVPSVFIVWAGLRFPSVESSAGRFGVRLGSASYALYLTHPFVMIVYAFLLKHTVLRSFDQRLLVPVVVLIAIFTGLAAHEIVERRLLAALSRVLKRSVGSASPTEEPQAS